MAVTSDKLKRNIQVVYNYGEVEGKLKKSTKSFSDASTDDAVATAQKIVDFKNAIKTLTDPIVESVADVLTTGHTETA